MTPSSVERETGVASRLVRQRKTGDNLQSITLASNLGHFLSAPPYKPPLDTPLIPPQVPLLVDSPWVATPPRLKPLAPLRHTYDCPLLVLSFRPGTGSSAAISPQHVVVLPGGARLFEGWKDPLPPALSVTYFQQAARVAEDILSASLEGHPRVVRQIGHPDSRFLSFRVAVSGWKACQYDTLIKGLSHRRCGGVFQASRHDRLFQDADDEEVRTILCREGYVPPRHSFRLLDPVGQYRVVSHGIVRFYSRLGTPTLIENLRLLNASAETSHDPGSSSLFTPPFQAISSSKGWTWLIALPARVASAGSVRQWGSTAPTNVTNWVPGVLVQGVGDTWTPLCVRDAL